ncbi:Pre-mRNA-splicing factor 18 [Hypsibius exemplaris]|uniref:Pre-mRNA-splicing factor 18 n=1 Tax=Hypsibius exemplaris TaxID=2072580 RepID=A0A1W0X990_HYPEX|nr:Pre-mRNA-splicing factor 18 [Hypsibius exemplaris]
MEALKAEIARKRKALETADVAANPESGHKYYKRADLEAKLADDYRKKQAAEQLSDGGPSGRESSPDVFTSKSKNRSGPAEYGEEVRLPRKEVVRRLRERNEPIRLFGESDEDSMLRLKDLEIQEPEVNVGFRNDLKAAMDKIDEEFMNEVAKGEHSPTKNATDIKIADDGTTLDDIRKLSEGGGEKNPNVTREVISKFIKFMMRRWAEELNRRSLEEKITQKGKLDRGTYVQTEDYLKSLFQKLRNKSLQDDISANLFKIIVYSLDGEYVRANEVFLQMAIGNAPWPIGVTAVGIHSRPGREKVFTQMIAHVLNDETQRKYIQGFKRLMTKMQQLYPGDPSRSVEYNAVAPLRPSGGM